jgi:hypothetical protein
LLPSAEFGFFLRVAALSLPQMDRGSAANACAFPTQKAYASYSAQKISR